MSVDLQPSELGFRRPFNREVTEILKLTNWNGAPVAFKVKTTAPKQYCVRPNSGMIQPNDTVEVQVLLQAMKEDPPLDAKCRDKFLVQSVLTSPDQDPNVTTLWQTVEKTAKSSIQERKIRVNFLPAAEAPTPNGVSSHEEQPPAYSSPSSQFGSPAPQSSSVTQAAETAKTSAANAADASGVTAVAAAAAAVSHAMPMSSEELKEQLAAAKDQIQKLTSQLQDTQSRQRKVQEAGEKVQTVVQQSHETGVPLQIVAGLCLLSFLIAYLFF
ncbi:uncharacterized protein Z518_06503 [Rhinocladiella mackenziei CBS 650.93]|uniref:MSP domain-containing protein n=1 Tax=Rhinocladiella mackenziei CBS 650.93 TaxID=1442369 RepID=A0A0D2GXQ9_9EURO|nr:uncharacterized protein Z518_06503 [Rhinocladiella mackenziei CBS 650.93]KIX02953.1 hypothetical protein Z518_06503 [Rhinocladiella mackenziei CBS 650.93]